jgi:hypothetical protein
VSLPKFVGPLPFFSEQTLSQMGPKIHVKKPILDMLTFKFFLPISSIDKGRFNPSE